MSFKEILLIRVLLLIAQIVATDEKTAQEIKNLASHVSVHGGKP